jgi:hypothetical protein
LSKPRLRLREVRHRHTTGFKSISRNSHLNEIFKRHFHFGLCHTSLPAHAIPGEGTRTTRFLCGKGEVGGAERIAERKARAESNTMSESEELSKNALKKKLKAEEAAKKKAVKDAEKAAKAVDAPKKEKLGGEEVEYDPTQYYENRLRTVNNLGVSTSHSHHLD